jgi:hypothetical protein
MGVIKMEAVRQALEERKHHLIAQVVKTDRRAKLKNRLEQEIWPTIPKGQLGKRLTRKEKAQIGYVSH